MFGTRAYLQAPLTFDKKSVNEILWAMDAGMAGNSTAIGDAMGLALKTLKDTPNPENKVIILLTDGENNDGSLSLAQATKLARDEGIKVYTIGVGSPENMVSSIFGIRLGAKNDLDEKGLQELAQATAAVTSVPMILKRCKQIYNTIDKLEPTEHAEQYCERS